MKNTIESFITTPISNILCKDTQKLDAFLYQSSKIHDIRFSNKESSIKFHKRKLGKQNYCWIGSNRHWVWETKTWRVFCCKRGSYFEVEKKIVY
ncbi:hypothetical protein UFOVP1290_484 [uncultured Caudovirales phage]|uniref:Uncharacterized protein n=1 Tax=uncultured Caudovirales phage TaxID=2100421 RepID=A0A6J5RY24_9CAUD|nr:hypothetical protein UFOVP1290_484 [uncultured Caudovirales phage]